MSTNEKVLLSTTVCAFISNASEILRLELFGCDQMIEACSKLTSMSSHSYVICDR